MKMDVSDFGNLRTLSAKIALAHRSSGGKWLYMHDSLEGVDKLANVGLLLLGKFEKQLGSLGDKIRSEPILAFFGDFLPVFWLLGK